MFGNGHEGVSAGGCVQRPEVSDAPRAGHQVNWASHGDNGDRTQELCRSSLDFNPLTFFPSPIRVPWVQLCLWLARRCSVLSWRELALGHHNNAIPYYSGKHTCAPKLGGQEGRWSLKSSFIQEKCNMNYICKVKFSGSFLNQDKKKKVWYFSVPTRQAVSSHSPAQQLCHLQGRFPSVTGGHSMLTNLHA